MTFQTQINAPADSYERLIRVEERLRHMDESQGIALRELKTAVAEGNATMKTELVEARARLTDLEKRVDKIYWLWSAAVFVGTPIMMAVSKFVFAKFGL